ncbi:MAG: HD domain-containing phosphohydrolase [Betaproteobacteria bacterium]
MNDQLITELLDEQPLPHVLMSLERSHFHQEPAREIGFYLEVRESLIRRHVVDGERECLIRALIVVARACFAAATPRHGLVAMERAEVVAAALPDSDLKRQLFTVKGALCIELGDFSGAFDAHARSLELARSLGNRESEARSIVNLSALFVDYGGYWDTLKLGEIVLSMHRKCALEPVTLAAALNNMTEACLATQQAERGIELGNQVLLVAPTDEAPQRAQLCTAHVLLARLHLLRGRVHAAERELIAARVLEKSCGSSRATQKVTIAGALIDHENGKLRHSVQSLKESLLVSGGDSSIAKDAMSALITVYEKEGHPKLALKYLKRLAALTERVNLDNARARLGALGLAEAHGGEGLSMEAHSFSNDFRLQTATLQKKLIDSQVEVLERLAVAAEMRDDVTGMHCYRVGKWAGLIALEMGLPMMEADTIEIAARLHDIGKVGVPDCILMKPEKLTASEFDLMKRHTILGARLLSRSRTPQIRMAEKVALSHHERWCGGGYPQGLQGEAIPMAGRITSVADVFDALTHERPYKHAWPVDDALGMIQSLSATWFDPAVVSAFFAVVERLNDEDGDLDQSIESRLKRSRIMRIREYALGIDDLTAASLNHT